MSQLSSYLWWSNTRHNVDYSVSLRGISGMSKWRRVVWILWTGEVPWSRGSVPCSCVTISFLMPCILDTPCIMNSFFVSTELCSLSHFSQCEDERRGQTSLTGHMSDRSRQGGYFHELPSTPLNRTTHNTPHPLVSSSSEVIFVSKQCRVWASTIVVEKVTFFNFRCTEECQGGKMGIIWLDSCVSRLVLHLLLKCYHLSCTSSSNTLQNPSVSPLFLDKTHFSFSKTFFVIDVRFDFCKYLTMQVTNLHKQDMKLKPASIFTRCMCYQPSKQLIIFWFYHLNRDETMKKVSQPLSRVTHSAVIWTRDACIIMILSWLPHLMMYLGDLDSKE